MFIEVEKWHFDNQASFKIVAIKKCCDDIVNSPNVCLKAEYEYDDGYGSYSDYSVRLIKNEYDYDGFAAEYFEKINFCPFCGKPIYIDIISEVDKNEVYERLTRERKFLWDKCNKTDSRKKGQELGKQVHALDKEINNLYESDDLKQ